MANLQQFEDQFVLLCEAGFIAVNQADEDAAVKLFNASQLINPKNNLPKVGKGYMHLMKLELGEACRCFNEVLTDEPDNEMAKSFLGLSYALTSTNMSKGEKILEEAVKSDDEQVKSLASTALDFVENFIKKAPSPMDMQKKNKKKGKSKE